MADVAEAVKAVNNQDVAGLNSRLRRMMKEVQSSQSANVSKFNVADFKRLNEYLDAYDVYLKWVMDQPELDCPETFLMFFDLEDFYPMVDVESEEVMDLQRLILRTHLELVNSQSTRLASRLIDQDHGRQVAFIEKMRTYLAAYIKVATPLDLPASSPDEARTTPPLNG